MSDAYEIAKAGGTNAGFLKMWEDKDREPILKSIRSLQKQADLHLDKIANPDKYITGAISERRREWLVKKHWPHEARTFQAQVDILRSILKERGHEE